MTEKNINNSFKMKFSKNKVKKEEGIGYVYNFII